MLPAIMIKTNRQPAMSQIPTSAAAIQKQIQRGERKMAAARKTAHASIGNRYRPFGICLELLSDLLGVSYSCLITDKQILFFISQKTAGADSW